VEYRWGEVSLARVPYIWEDDMAMGAGGYEANDALRLLSDRGVKVFDFHPLHVYLDALDVQASTDVYGRVQSLPHALQDEVDPFRRDGGDGVRATRQVFIDLLDHLAAEGRAMRI